MLLGRLVVGLLAHQRAAQRSSYSTSLITSINLSNMQKPSCHQVAKKRFCKFQEISCLNYHHYTRAVSIYTGSSLNVAKTPFDTTFEMTTVAVCQSKTESYNKAHKDDIIAAYNDVRDDKTATNWALLDYEEGKESVFVSEKGTGGLSELKTHLGEEKAQFAFVRYSYSNDPMSQRAKFVLISWCGPKVKIMRKV